MASLRKANMDKIVVYTVILGGYDRLWPPLMWNGEAEYVCLSDTPIPKTPPWEVRLVTPESNDMRREARRLKVLSHRYFPRAEYVLFHDGNIRLNTEAPSAWLGERDMALCAHPERDCIYEEVEACVQLNKDKEETMRAQVARYKAEGYPKDAGLVATTVILRRQSTAIRLFNECWWAEIAGGSVRDQLSFNYVCWKLGMKYDVIPGDLFRNEQFQYVFPHGR